MYKEHFGLKRGLFEGGIAREEDVFLGPRQQLVIANIKIALTTRDSAATLVGPVGVGKTTLASRALRMATTRLALAWLGNAPLTADEVLELLLAEFDLKPYGMGKVERLQTWRQFMSELSVTDTRLCILVENAQALGVEALRALEPLTAADPNGCPGANLVIMGQPGLYELFENPALAQLKQRIRSRQRLDPLSATEVEAYLRCRAAAAGGEFDRLFAPGAGAALHCYSAGIPRVIDNVCESALSLAAARRLPRLTPVDLMRVAERVYGLAPRGPVPVFPSEPAVSAPVERSAEQTSSPAEPRADVPPTVEPEISVTAGEPDESTDAPPPIGASPDSAEAQTLSGDEEEAADPAPSPAEPPVSMESAGTAEVTWNEEEADDPVPPPVEPPVLSESAGTGQSVWSDREADDPIPSPAEPPVLTESAELETQTADYAADSDGEDAGGEAEAEAAKKAAQALADARNLEDISNSMAETLFGNEEIEMLAAALEAAQPDGPARESAGTGLSPEETSAVLQLSEDAVAESAEEQSPEAGAEPPPAPQAGQVPDAAPTKAVS